MAMWPAKDPDALTDYRYDVPLDTNDTVASVVASVAYGTVEIERQPSDATGVNVWLKGGVDGETAAIRIAWTTADGRSDDDTVTIQIRQSSALDVLPLEDARQHLNDPPRRDDRLIVSYIDAAIGMVERSAGLILKRRQVVEDVRGRSGWRLNAWPVISIDAIERYDLATGAVLTEESPFLGMLRTRPASINPVGSWPDWSEGSRGFVTLTAGYDAPGTVPQEIVQALRLIVGEFYLNREIGALTPDTQRAVHWLLEGHRMQWL